LADIVYVESGYLEPGYTVYTAAAGSSLTSTARLPDDPYLEADYVASGYLFTPTFDATVIKSAVSNVGVVTSTTVSVTRSRPGASAVTVSVTQSTNAARTRTANATATVASTITADGRFQQQGAASISSTFTVAVTATATKPTGADLTAFDTIAVTALANKNFTAGLSAVSTLSATPSVTRDAGFTTATVTWDSQDSSWDDWQHLYWDPDNGIWISTRSSVYAFPVVSGDNQFLLSSEFVTYNNGGYVLTGSATLAEDASEIFAIGGFEKTTGATASVVSSVAVAGEKIHSTTSADFATVVAVSATADVIPPTRGQATLTTAFETYNNGGLIESAAATVSGEFVFQAESRTPGLQIADANLKVTVSQISQARFTASAASAMNITGTISSQAQRVREGLSAVQVSTTVNTVFTRLRILSSGMNTQFVQTATSTRVIAGQSAISTASDLIILAGYVLSGISNIASNSATTITGARRRNSTATITAAGFVLTAGDVFTIDPDFQLIVRLETRFYPVLPELRLRTVTQQTRVNTILPESRVIEVPQETRQETVL
jgi:hypothetical protein